MTSIIGQTENGLKTTQVTPKVLPEVSTNSSDAVTVDTESHSGGDLRR